MAFNARCALIGIALVFSLLAAGGCGDDDSDSGGSGSGGGSSSAGGGSGSAGTSEQKARPNSVAAKAPKAVLQESADALEQARSFHVEGDVRIDGKQTAVKADFERPSKLKMSLAQGGLEATILTTGGSVFINANEAFWKQQGVADNAGQFAGRWFKTPASGKDVKSFTEDLDPKTLSYCLTKDHGTLERGGRDEVDGRLAVVIVDKGDRPGTSPGKLFVAATGEPFPLRLLLTGDERPGGKKDPRCGDENDEGDEGRAGDELTFSRYNESLGIKPPPKAVDLSQQGGARTES